MLSAHDMDAQRRPTTPARSPGTAVVTVLAYRGPRDAVATATGFLVTDGRVVTALRPLLGATKLEVYTTKGDLLGTATSLDAADVKTGIVALPRLGRPPATVGFARRSPVLGDKVTVFLAPKGVTRGTAEQTVAAVEAGSADQGFVFKLGAPVAGDAVGAPVLDARGDMVGMALGSIPGRDDRDLAVDVATVRKGAEPVVPVRPSGPPTVPVASDTLGPLVIDLFACSLAEAKKELTCLMRVTNNATTPAKVVVGESVEQGGTIQRTKGWRAKASFDLRELDATRFSVIFTEVAAKVPERASLVVRIGGGGDAWFGPFTLTRVP
ncbi:MAG: serine protease [Gemmatimonadaceae bacterium]|nr:serine protease [Gemmatimonadaceae bacterium]